MLLQQANISLLWREEFFWVPRAINIASLRGRRPSDSCCANFRARTLDLIRNATETRCRQCQALTKTQSHAQLLAKL